MIEIQKNGGFKVTLKKDERICVAEVPNMTLAVEIDRALDRAYHRGTLDYPYRARPYDDDGDSD